jgi:tetratricopeptide (TPR) repeat protein
MEIVYLDLQIVNDNQANLWCYRDPLGADRSPVSRSGLDTLVQDIENRYYLCLENRPWLNFPEEIGQELYTWLNGSDGVLDRKINGRANILLAISVQDKLAHLPWKLLHDGTNFLIDRSILPVRWVRQSSHSTATISIENRQPDNRPLRLFFMATDPESSSYPSLSYETEEAQILQMNEGDIVLKVEDSGCLQIAKTSWGRYGENYFDIFHLTGHADIDSDTRTSFFVTEQETGEEQKSSIEDIVRTFDNSFPKLIFLSGCHSARAAIAGSIPSLAEALIRQGNGLKAVLGWGRDTEATRASVILYRALNNGRSLFTALASTYQDLLRNSENGWHLLRLYIGDTLPNKFVTPPATDGRARAPVIPLTSETFGSGKVADMNSFVGRRRQIQRCLKVLRASTYSTEKVGVIIQGFGGYGKSSLAARLRHRLSDYVPIVFDLQENILDARSFTNKLSDELAKTQYPVDVIKIIQDQDKDREFPSRLTILLEQLREVEPRKKFLFIFDDFERALELIDGNSEVTQFNNEEARRVLSSLLAAIRTTYPETRVVITSRYDLPDLPDFPEKRYLVTEPLSEMSMADRKKKLKFLTAFNSNTVDRQWQERAERIADGNPRLLEWLNDILSESTLNNEEILQRLESLENDLGDLRETVLAEELIRQLNDRDQLQGIKQILVRGLIFEIPVPPEALEEVCREINDFQQHIRKAIKLGLLSVNPNGELRVPRILPLAPPDNRQSVSERGARILYKLWFQPSSWTTEQASEILRLALDGEVRQIGVEVGDKLAKKFIEREVYRQAIEISQKIIDKQWSNLRIYYNLARSHYEIRNMAEAEQYYQLAKNKPHLKSLEARGDLSDLLRGRGHLLGERYSDNQAGNLSRAVRFLEESLQIAEEINDPIRQAWSKSALGKYLKFQASDRQNTELSDQERQELLNRAKKYFESALELSRKGRDRQAEANSLSHLATIYNIFHGRNPNQGNDNRAEELMQDAWRIKTEMNAFRSQGAQLHQWGKIYLDRGDLAKAEQYLTKALRLKQIYDGVPGTTSYQLARLRGRQNRVLNAFEFLAEALDYHHRAEHRDQGRAWDLFERLFKKWKRLNFPGTEEGCDSSARYLMQKFGELAENPRYNYRYGKALAFWGLGQLAINEGNIEGGREDLQTAHRILAEIGSDDAIELQQSIDRIGENGNR